jgi:mRNA interferase RelE/StbE
MAGYSVVFKKSVYKDMASIPPKDNQSILGAIRSLSENPRPEQSKKLSGDEKYRLRCGNYRLLYEINDDEVVICIVKGGHRKDIYR